MSDDQPHFRLFINGPSERLLLAQENLRRLCRQHLSDQCTIEIIDVSLDPLLTVKHELVAMPALDITHRSRTSRLIGDLTLARQYIAAMGMAREAEMMRERAQNTLARVRAERLPGEE